MYGKAGLVPRLRRKPEMPNRTPVLEQQILLQTLEIQHSAMFALPQ
jgi:hypothetical protein